MAEQQTTKLGDELITQGKFYEYSQKMKLLANRRIQSGRFPEALNILSTASKQLLQHNEINEGYELLSKWIDTLSQHPQLFTKQTQKTFLELYNSNQSDKRIQFLQQIPRRFGNSINRHHFFHLLSQQLIRLQRFFQAQRYTLPLDLKSGLNLLQTWAKHLAMHEVDMVFCRFALQKMCLEGREEEARHVIEIMPTSAFKRLAELTFEAVRSKSKKAFEVILREYKGLLAADVTFQRTFEWLGAVHFNIEPKQKQQGLFSTLLQK